MLNTHRYLMIAVAIVFVHLGGIAWIEWGSLPARYTPSQKRLVVKTLNFSSKTKKEKIVAAKPASKQTIVAKPAPKKTVVAKPAPKKNEKQPEKIVKQTNLRNDLITQAKERLNQVSKISKTIDTATTIESMQVDSLEEGVEDHGYYRLLAARLRKDLRLPEYGEVKVHLYLNCQGDVIQVKLITAQNENNRRYVERTLPNVHFPPFGKAFQNEKTHTFTITLAND